MIGLIGQKFGLWKIIDQAESNKRGGPYYRCVCDCGSERTVRGPNLSRGLSRSCGCAERPAKHGHTRQGKMTPEYRARVNAIQRCTNPLNCRFSEYGARGIRMCDRWLYGENGMSGFECFLADMGPKPSPRHSIDRVDNDKGYSPDNCRWATASIQARNKQPIKLNAAQAEEIRALRGRPLKEISERYGVSKSNICLIQTGRAWRPVEAAA
jgi:hypothetical protein